MKCYQMFGGIRKHDADPVAGADAVALKIGCGNTDSARKIGVADDTISVLDRGMLRPVIRVSVDDIRNLSLHA